MADTRAGPAPSTRASAVRPAWQGGLAIALAVLGAGLILSPPITVGLAGRQGWLAFLAHLVLGGTFCFAVGVLGRIRGPVSGLAELAGKAGWPAFGRVGAARVVTSLYLGGFIAGQAAIALTAGWLIGYVLNGSGRSAASNLMAVGSGVGVIVFAVAVNAAGRSVPRSARNWRILVAFLLAVALCSDPGLLRASEMLPVIRGPEFWTATFLLLFAGVGWERSAALASSVGSDRAMARAVLSGWVIVAAAYLVLCVIAEISRGAGQGVWPSAMSRSLALLAAALLASFCVTNVEAASGFLVTLAPVAGKPDRLSRPAAAVAVGTAVSLVLACALGAGWHAYQLLAGPAVATLLIYLIALCSGLKREAGEQRDRRLIVVLTAPLALLLFTAAAAVWQVAVG